MRRPLRPQVTRALIDPLQNIAMTLVNATEEVRSIPLERNSFFGPHFFAFHTHKQFGTSAVSAFRNATSG